MFAAVGDNAREEFWQTQGVLAGGEDGWSCLSRPVVRLRRCGTGKPGSCPGFCLQASLQRRACFFLLLLRLGKSSSTEDAPTTQCRIPQVSTNKLRFIPQRSIALTRGREDGVFGFADDTPPIEFNSLLSTINTRPIRNTYHKNPVGPLPGAVFPPRKRCPAGRRAHTVPPSSFLSSPPLPVPPMANRLAPPPIVPGRIEDRWSARSGGDRAVVNQEIECC